MLRQEEIDRIAEEIAARMQKNGQESGKLPEARAAEKQTAACKLESALARQQAASRHASHAEQGQGVQDTAKAARGAGECTEAAAAREDEASGPGRPRPAGNLPDVADADLLRRMKAKTTARIGVGRAGPRLRTDTLLTLRADHAAARDAVFLDVSPELIEKLGLLPVTTCCPDKNTFLTRPDLGRDFTEETRKQIREACTPHPDVQLIVSDGLSSAAIEANAARILPVVMEGLKDKGLTVGTPIFVKYGRVGAQDRIAELLDAKVVCSFIGERPGLATAESMSAYLAYRARVGMPEARRTVVSNIHRNGVPAVEAGAYIVDLIALILEQGASGVELKK